jgi:hypothetical protein
MPRWASQRPSRMRMVRPRKARRQAQIDPEERKDPSRSPGFAPARGFCPAMTQASPLVRFAACRLPTQRAGVANESRGTPESQEARPSQRTGAEGTVGGRHVGGDCRGPDDLGRTKPPHNLPPGRTPALGSHKTPTYTKPLSLWCPLVVLDDRPAFSVAPASRCVVLQDQRVRWGLKSEVITDVVSSDPVSLC